MNLSAKSMMAGNETALAEKLIPAARQRNPQSPHVQAKENKPIHPLD
jgi:hypothetical protein